MGGSGGSAGVDPGDLRRLEREAKRILSGGGEGQRRNVFLSFSSTDLDSVNLLRGQAKNENSELDFKDWSVKVPFDSEEAEYIRRKIRERIRQCSVTIVFLSDETAGSRWVDWEVRESLRLGKGVVGMYQGEAPPERMPAVIGENAIRVVPWRHRDLSRAVEGAAEEREGSR